MLGNDPHLHCPSYLQPPNITGDDASEPRLVNMLKPGLEARDVLLDLLQESQMSRQFCQSWIRCYLRLIEHGGTCGNQNRVERIVLGPTQMHPAKRLDLGRLQHQH